MSTMHCNLCNRPVEASRNIGVGSLLLVLMTGGAWLLAIPLYPKRCSICKSPAVSNAAPGGAVIPQKPINWKGIWILIGVLFLPTLLLPLLRREPQYGSSPAPASAAAVAAKSNVVKKDGTVSTRPNDLEELCKDWAFYKARIYKAAGSGDLQAAAEARTSFATINAYLSQYNESDVSRTCAKYDT